jgi:hypothetical protein
VYYYLVLYCLTAMQLHVPMTGGKTAELETEAIEWCNLFETMQSVQRRNIFVCHDIILPIVDDGGYTQQKAHFIRLAWTNNTAEK